MKNEKKKSPNDYPLFSFRVSVDDKSRIIKEIEHVAKALNKKRTKDQKVVRGNHVAVEAMLLGLKILKSKNQGK